MGNLKKINIEVIFLFAIILTDVAGSHLGETGVGWDKKRKKKAFINFTILKTL